MSILKCYLHSSFMEGGREENSSGFNVVAVAVPAVLLLLLIPAVVVAVFLYRRFVYFKTEY